MTEASEEIRTFVPPLQRTLGIKMRLGPEGEGIAWIDVDREKHWGRTRVHGGVIPALVDVAGAVTVAHTTQDAVNAIEGTIQMTVNYLKPAGDGDLTAMARVIHRGGRVGVAEVEVTNNGELCAKALVTYMLRSARPASS